MKIYLVGGAVRDKLLGLAVKEKDWVVVGATPEEILALGYQPVGKEFPVFLHPKTKEEYALARTERKVAKGYKGFTFYADKDVTLEQDLLRRDLTINAIAEDDDGKLIDPYHGQQDLKQKIFRHVSPAFEEDPVRILRLARFASRFTDFIVADETLTLMKKMVGLGEVDALVAERVWQEFRRALNNNNPVRFFEVLSACDAQAILFPRIKETNLKHLTKAIEKIDDPRKRFAALCCGLSLDETNQLIQRYKIPNDYGDLAKLLIKCQQEYREFDSLEPDAVLHFFTKSDALRRPDRFVDFLDVADVCLDLTIERQKIKTLLTNIKQVDMTPLQEQGLKGEAFAAALKALRIQAIAKHL